MSVAYAPDVTIPSLMRADGAHLTPTVRSDNRTVGEVEGDRRADLSKVIGEKLRGGATISRRGCDMSAHGAEDARVVVQSALLAAKSRTQRSACVKSERRGQGGWS